MNFSKYLDTDGLIITKRNIPIYAIKENSTILDVNKFNLKLDTIIEVDTYKTALDNILKS